MTIEEEIFEKTKVDFNKLSKYGFKKDKKFYTYSKNIMNNSFRVNIEINDSGKVKGNIIDLYFKEEYSNFRMDINTGTFASQVKEEYVKILKDIRKKCFTSKLFIYDQSNRIAKLIKEKYGDEPKFEWEKFPGYATFKNNDSKKWYGVIMNIDKNKINKKSSGKVEIINIKVEPNEIKHLLSLDGFYPAYHMNKNNWITVILNNTVSDKKIMNLIEKSYLYTVANKNNAKNTWIVPANPKYFDIEQALEKNNTITWKQSTKIKINDIVYMYVAEPYSSIMYKFKVLETNIPYEYKDKNLKIQKVMKVDLITRYEKGKLSFKKLKDFGINAIRGPRYMPLSLSKYIQKIESISCD